MPAKKKKYWAYPQPVKFNVIVTTHADRRIRARMGTGTSTHTIACRAWESRKAPPTNWHFPRIKRLRCTYYAYGECVFVFNNHKDGNIYLITIFGPYRPDGSWWKDGAWVRIN